MLIFIQSVIAISLFLIVVKSLTDGKSKNSKLFAIAILIVGFLVLPGPIKAMILSILFMYLLARLFLKNFSKYGK